MTQYETVIGLEVHLQLATQTKAFCGCKAKFGARPNSHTCPVCLGFPGSLPVLNEDAFGFAIKVALALGCVIQDLIKFDRKNYYYPDLPKNFQISQYDMPLAYDGFIDIALNGRKKRIRIKRVHMEEDAGKLMHEPGYSLIDYNRSGVPLLEIVTEPDLSSPEEAYEYLTKLKAILKYLRISDCDMEKGSLRCDANVSLRPAGEKKLGVKVEVKNMNSFKGVRSALEYETGRQAAALRDGEKIVQETRLWDADRQMSNPMRSKEEAEEYRYFPEPDLVPFVVDKKEIMRIKRGLPELPEARAARFIKEFALPEYDAGVITSDIELAEYFEETARLCKNTKAIANWMMGDIMARISEKGVGIRDMGLTPAGLSNLLDMIDSGAISGKMAKDVLFEAMETGNDPKDIVSRRGLLQVSDRGEIETIVKSVIARNVKSVSDYRAGKKNAFTFLVGQVMKDTKGKANPMVVNDILKKTLGS